MCAGRQHRDKSSPSLSTYQVPDVVLSFYINYLIKTQNGPVRDSSYDQYTDEETAILRS